MKALIKIFLITIMLISCNNKNYSRTDFVGKWKCNYKYVIVDILHSLIFTAEYKDDGNLLIEGHGIFIDGDSKATYQFSGISKWRIENNNLIESTIKEEYFNYNGDYKIIQFLKEQNSHQEEYNVIVSKIIDITKNKIILHSDGDGDKITITLNRID